jgi:hypothetical protein
MNTLHIYGQTARHGNAFIVGDTEALKELRDTIDQVLKTGNPAKFESMVKDGEGYFTYVACRNNRNYFENRHSRDEKIA